MLLASVHSTLLPLQSQEAPYRTLGQGLCLYLLLSPAALGSAHLRSRVSPALTSGLKRPVGADLRGDRLVGAKDPISLHALLGRKKGH